MARQKDRKLAAAAGVTPSLRNSGSLVHQFMEMHQTWQKRLDWVEWKNKRFGKLGAASPVRHIDPSTWTPPEGKR